MQLSMALRRVATLAGSLLALNAWGETLAQFIRVSEHDFIGELPVVLSVSRLSQSVADAPGAVTIIDREMIRLSGAREISELFRLVPGFSVARPPQAAPVVVYHGLTETFPRRMQILVDGRSQYQPFEFGGVNWNLIQVALDDIERIEVVRGSNSAAYGSNAFLGVANIITRRGSQVPGLTISANSGDDGIGDNFVRIGHVGEHQGFRLSLTEDRDQGLQQVRDNRSRHGLDARLDYRFDARNEMTLRYGTQSATVQIGQRNSPSNPEREERRTQDYFQVDWQRNLGSDSDLALRYARTHEDLNNDILIVTAGTSLAGEFGNVVVPVDYNSSAERDELELQHTLAPSPTTRLVWGGNWREDRVRSKHFFSTSEPQLSRVWRLFGNLEWRPVDNLVLNLGATHEDDSNSGSTASPRLMASAHVADGQTLRFGVSRAVRTPSLLELRANETFVDLGGNVVERLLLGNRQVEPETLLVNELGYLGEFPRIGVTLDARAFLERVRRRIDVLPRLTTAPLCERNATGLTTLPFGYCGRADLALNQQRADITGLEYQLDYRPFAGAHLRVGQAFVHINAANPLPTDDFSVFPPALQQVLTTQQQTLIQRGVAQIERSSPTHTTTLSWMQRFASGFDLSLIYTNVGAMGWTGNTRADAYERLDWRIARSLAIGATRGEVAFTVFGEGSSHAEFASIYPQEARGVFTVRLEY